MCKACYFSSALQVRLNNILTWKLQFLGNAGIFFTKFCSFVQHITSVVTKAVYPETEAPGFETEAIAFETEAKTEAVDPETEAKAARQYINKSHIWAVSLKRKEYKHFLT